MNAFNILIIIAIIIAVLSLIRPTWPLLAVAVILVCAALLTGK